jgi:uncharacterized protein (TIGR02996 family)
MNAIAYLLEAIAAELTDAVVWLALADALEEQGQLQQADLTRRHRRLLAGERTEEMLV